MLAIKNSTAGNFLVVQWLGFGAFTAVGPGSVPGRGAKIPQAKQHGQKKYIYSTGYREESTVRVNNYTP